MIDIPALRALLADGKLLQPRPWTPASQGPLYQKPDMWKLMDENGFAVLGDVTRDEAHLIAAAVNDLPALLDELEALRAERDGWRTEHENALACWRTDLTNVVAAWRTATGCDSPGQAEQLARDAVVVREGHWDALLAERERWKLATGCDTPEEAGEEMALTQHGHDQWHDEVKRWRALTGCDSPEDLHASVASNDAQMVELARLRELERTVLAYRQACEEESGPVAADDTDEQMHARIERLNRLGAAEDAAIAACRAAKEGT